MTYFESIMYSVSLSVILFLASFFGREMGSFFELDMYYLTCIFVCSIFFSFFVRDLLNRPKPLSITANMSFFTRIVISSLGLAVFGLAFGYGLPLHYVLMVYFGVQILLVGFWLYGGAGDNSAAHYKTNIDALPGKHCIVTRTVAPYTLGQVRLGGELWSAQPVHDEVFLSGTVIMVVRVEGVRLIVAKIV